VLNSLRPVCSDATQLNSTSSWVELRRYRHPHRRNSTVAYKLSQLGHDVQNWSVTVVQAVNVSTTGRRVELSCVAINGPLVASLICCIVLLKNLLTCRCQWNVGHRPPVSILVYTLWAIKTCHWIFVQNFEKCWPISKIIFHCWTQQ